jgi:hypothetical protein
MVDEMMGRKISASGPRSKPGGDNDIPRSLGKVFKAIRLSLNLSQADMRKKLEATPSPFRLPKPKGDTNPSATISTWESGRENIPFAVQHRYARLVGTYTGILHITSLFHANWRDAAETTDAAVMKSRLAENAQAANGLIALAQLVLKRNENGLKLKSHAAGTPLGEDEEPELLQSIQELLAAYRTGATSDLSS